MVNQETQAGNSVIAMSHLNKVYHSDEEGDRTALADISLDIDKGDIFGIIGLSGAGKSTLVRCINGLESYQGGSLKVRGQEVASLNSQGLRELRQRTGMIFQHFNLMPSRTLLGNVELPLHNSNLTRLQRASRAQELLELVGLSDLAQSYPGELSGGQQQRVAIARSLANKPDILLSDEATSALDPNTTKSILALLRDLHDQLGITVVMITHEMAVVRQICNRLAVIDQGRIVEEGRVFDIFAKPKAPLTRSFVATTSNLDKVGDLIEQESPIVQLEPGQVLLKMSFLSKAVNQAMVSTISRLFDVDVNIIFGDVDVVEGSQLGGLVVRLEGSAEHVEQALAYMSEHEVGIEVLNRG
ncbi:methionine import ATP-binding protein MetN [Bombiscardovia apis]|uniref:Methionine import ATP-binding protein MetN n=1 Tax=Bombiscardovia apis TaxID=2932182 RepID=A0ABN6SI80_9BIFI|nr:ATP-binding cassette domain-containing protein [Bombiscardovia apis]BDR55008.1 methionine import ATP-binding protein MetN [Bombiscardovia apis]